MSMKEKLESTPEWRRYEAAKKNAEAYIAGLDFEAARRSRADELMERIVTGAWEYSVSDGGAFRVNTGKRTAVFIVARSLVDGRFQLHWQIAASSQWSKHSAMFQISEGIPEIDLTVDGDDCLLNLCRIIASCGLDRYDGGAK